MGLSDGQRGHDSGSQSPRAVTESGTSTVGRVRNHDEAALIQGPANQSLMIGRHILGRPGAKSFLFSVSFLAPDPSSGTRRGRIQGLLMLVILYLRDSTRENHHASSQEKDVGLIETCYMPSNHCLKPPTTTYQTTLTNPISTNLSTSTLRFATLLPVLPLSQRNTASATLLAQPLTFETSRIRICSLPTT